MCVLSTTVTDIPKSIIRIQIYPIHIWISTCAQGSASTSFGNPWSWLTCRTCRQIIYDKAMLIRPLWNFIIVHMIPGPMSRYPVTCACLCGLVEGWVPVDASSGYLVIDWAVETRRWGARWWPWWCLGGDMPHWIEIAIVFMNWHITLYCFYLLFFTNNCCFSIKVYHVLPCMSRNTGQINPAGFQSLKYMYYTHVIMTIKWFLTLTLTYIENK